MSARFDSPWFNLILLALVGRLTAVASLGRGMHRIIRPAMVVHLVWISLLCGASWTTGPRLAEQPGSAPYATLQHDISPPPTSQRLILKESDACEKLLASLEREPDAGLSDDDVERDALDAAPRILLLALLHSGLSPPSATAPQPYPSIDRPLASARLRSPSEARAPPRR